MTKDEIARMQGFRSSRRIAANVEIREAARKALPITSTVTITDLSPFRIIITVTLPRFHWLAFGLSHLYYWRKLTKIFAPIVQVGVLFRVRVI